MRQAASLIGVSHTTVSDALKADRALAEEVTAARFHAQLQPLACVIRESRRSWRAASWLLKPLCETISQRDETPDEAQAGYVREQEEFLARGRRKRLTPRAAAFAMRERRVPNGHAEEQRAGRNVSARFF